jgi:hypothetical protein
VRVVFSLAAIGLMFLCTTQCGSVFVGGAIQPGTATVHGSITNVQLGNVISNVGSTVQVTFVTFLQGGAFTTLGFCNNQINQFPLNQTVNVNFNPGQSCATLIVVVVVN